MDRKQSSLIWVQTVCYSNVFKGPADGTQQTTFSSTYIVSVAVLMFYFAVSVVGAVSNRRVDVTLVSTVRLMAGAVSKIACADVLV